MDKLAVGDTIDSCCRVDSRNPKSTELTLLDATVTKSVIQRSVDSFRGTSKKLTPRTPVTFCKLENLISSLSRFKTSFYSDITSPFLKVPDPQGETFPHGSRQ